jgi:hypothetical protein
VRLPSTSLGHSLIRGRPTSPVPSRLSRVTDTPRPTDQPPKQRIQTCILVASCNCHRLVAPSSVKEPGKCWLRMASSHLEARSSPTSAPAAHLPAVCRLPPERSTNLKDMGELADKPPSGHSISIRSRPDRPRPVAAEQRGRVTMRTRSKRWGVLVGVSALGLGLAACSSPSASPSASHPANPSQALLTAVHSSTDQSSADIGMTVTAAVGGKSIRVSGKGSVDLASSAMQMAMSFEGVPQLSGTTVSIIVDDGTAYISYPGISTVVPGKTWISEPASASTTSGVQVSNASDLLKVLAAKGAVVNKTGVGTIGSTPVTQYSVELTPSLIAAQTGSLGIPSSDSATLQQLAQNGLTFVVYVNPANQIRRLRIQVAVPATSSSPSTQESIVVDFTNYGTPVSVSAPPASAVTTLQQLQGSSGAST